MPGPILPFIPCAVAGSTTTTAAALAATINAKRRVLGFMSFLLLIDFS
jgi:hypothetical protein